MSNHQTQYLELSSSYRNRVQYPNPGFFEVLQTENGGASVNSDPVSLGAPQRSWTGGRFNCSGSGSPTTSVLTILDDSDNCRFRVSGDFNTLQQRQNYYRGALINVSDTNRVNSSGCIKRRISQYKYLGYTENLCIGVSGCVEKADDKAGIVSVSGVSQSDLGSLGGGSSLSGSAGDNKIFVDGGEFSVSNIGCYIQLEGGTQLYKITSLVSSTVACVDPIIVADIEAAKTFSLWKEAIVGEATIVGNYCKSSYICLSNVSGSFNVGNSISGTSAGSSCIKLSLITDGENPPTISQINGVINGSGTVKKDIGHLVIDKPLPKINVSGKYQVLNVSSTFAMNSSGTVSVTNASSTVTGSGTDWTAYESFPFSENGKSLCITIYNDLVGEITSEIVSIISSTSLSLKDVLYPSSGKYANVSGTGLSFKIFQKNVGSYYKENCCPSLCGSLLTIKDPSDLNIKCSHFLKEPVYTLIPFDKESQMSNLLKTPQYDIIQPVENQQKFISNSYPGSPVLFVPDGPDGTNFYNNTNIYNETLKEIRRIISYDNVSKLIQFDTNGPIHTQNCGPIGKSTTQEDWKICHSYSIRKDIPLNTVYVDCSSTAQTIVIKIDPAEKSTLQNLIPDNLEIGSPTVDNQPFIRLIPPEENPNASGIPNSHLFYGSGMTQINSYAEGFTGGQIVPATGVEQSPPWIATVAQTRKINKIDLRQNGYAIFNLERPFGIIDQKQCTDSDTPSYQYFPFPAIPFCGKNFVSGSSISGTQSTDGPVAPDNYYTPPRFTLVDPGMVAVSIASYRRMGTVTGVELVSVGNNTTVAAANEPTFVNSDISASGLVVTWTNVNLSDITVGTNGGYGYSVNDLFTTAMSGTAVFKVTSVTSYLPTMGWMSYTNTVCDSNINQRGDLNNGNYNSSRIPSRNPLDYDGLQAFTLSVLEAPFEPIECEDVSPQTAQEVGVGKGWVTVTITPALTAAKGSNVLSVESVMIGILGTAAAAASTITIINVSNTSSSISVGRSLVISGTTVSVQSIVDSQKGSDIVPTDNVSGALAPYSYLKVTSGFGNAASSDLRDYIGVNIVAASVSGADYSTKWNNFLPGDHISSRTYDGTNTYLTISRYDYNTPLVGTHLTMEPVFESVSGQGVSLLLGKRYIPLSSAGDLGQVIVEDRPLDVCNSPAAEILLQTDNNCIDFIYTPTVKTMFTNNDTAGNPFDVELVNLIVPNQLLAVGYGSLPSFYTYFYVKFGNGLEQAAGNSGKINTNNPHGYTATFRVSIDDVPNPVNSTFIKLDGDGTVQQLTLDPHQPLYFALYLPSGEIFRTEMDDDFSPFLPNPLVQVSALFSIRLAGRTVHSNQKINLRPEPRSGARFYNDRSNALDYRRNTKY